ncbi:MAG: DNA-formamidopyrimidine glycosylase [Patescibacteria group bacterium]
MPELPEVETITRELKKVLILKTIQQVKIKNSKTVHPLKPRSFSLKLQNKSITDIKRRAKIIIFKLNNDDYILIHLKMTGQLIYSIPNNLLITGGHPQPDGEVNLPNKFTRLIFYFTDNSILYFNDMRKFGWVRLVTKEDLDNSLKKLGIEPLSKEFTFNKFKEIIKKYPKRSLKKLLLDQTQIAGLGNIYVDEICFLTGLRPDRKTYTLTETQIKKLYQNIIKILKLAIKHKGTSSKNYVTTSGQPGNFVHFLKVYGREKKPCLNCQTPIKKINHIGRGTHFCSKCQK